MAATFSHDSAEAARGLGGLVATYRPRLAPRLGRFAAGAAAVVAGLGGLALGSSVARLQMFTGMFFIGVGAALAVFGGFTVQSVVSAMRVRVRLFEGGFVWAEGGAADGFRWDQIAAVHTTETAHRWNGQVIYRTHSFQITARNGREVRLEDGDIDGGEDLGQAIVREVRRAKTKAALAAALRLEAEGQRESALAEFEQIMAESPDLDVAGEARIHAHRLRERADDS